MCRSVSVVRSGLVCCRNAAGGNLWPMVGLRGGVGGGENRQNHFSGRHQLSHYQLQASRGMAFFTAKANDSEYESHIDWEEFAEIAEHCAAEPYPFWRKVLALTLTNLCNHQCWS